MRGVHRQVAQRYITEERSHLRRTDLGPIRLIRGDDARPIIFNEIEIFVVILYE
jgi:hypothetical protein